MAPHFNCLSSASSITTMEVETAVEVEVDIIQLRSVVNFTTCLQEARGTGDKL